MIVGFSKHGTGAGAGPVGYVMSKTLTGRNLSPPVAVRGDPAQTAELIDSLDFKWKYTSGVLSFAPGEEITPEIESAIMDRFEDLAFAGLDADQYNILWVRHSHAGHHELHFVTPRVELETAKSLNIKPPGKKTQQQYDDFRSEVNARYELADPDDPERARMSRSPDYELKIAKQALRTGHKPTADVRRLITDVLLQRMNSGLVNNRNDVVQNIQELGFTVARQGEHYLTAVDPDSGKRLRLKGKLYEQRFDSRTLGEETTGRARDFSRPNAERAQDYAQKVSGHIKKRAEYHRTRYPTPDTRPTLERTHQSLDVARGHRPALLLRDGDRSLGGHAVPGQPDNPDQPSQSDHRAVRKSGQQDPIQSVRGSRETLHQDGRSGGTLQQQSPDTTGVLDHDATRNPLIERLERFRDAIQRTTQRLADSTLRITKAVRSYLEREQNAEGSNKSLSRASDELEHTTQGLKQTKQKSRAYILDHNEDKGYDMGM